MAKVVVFITIGPQLIDAVGPGGAAAGASVAGCPAVAW